MIGCDWSSDVCSSIWTIAPWNGAFGVRFPRGRLRCHPRSNAAMQEQRLWIADPKAVYHIIQSSSHLYETPQAVREMLAMVLDRGVGLVSGESPFIYHTLCNRPLTPSPGDKHKRYRRAMAPAFGLVETKALHPHFSHCSNSVGHSYIHR